MRSWTLYILGTVVLSLAPSLAAVSHADARPRFGPAAVLGAVTAPFGAMLGGFRPAVGQHGRSSTSPAEDKRSDDDARAQLRLAASVSRERPAAVFWPEASADLVAYMVFPSGRDDRFWALGFGKIMDAVFADGYDPRMRGRRLVHRESSAASPATATASSGRVDLCGKASAAAQADALIERIERAIRPNAAQRAVLDQLEAAFAQAIERIDSACPRATLASPTERLQAIQDRIWAMRDALLTIRLPLERFYDSLTHEQHWRLHREEPDAIETTGAKLADARGPMCVEPMAAFAGGSMRTIERAVRPNETQRASLEALRLRSAGMAQLIAGSCPTYPLLGHMGRFAAATDRLDVMLFAVMALSPALQDFYQSLDDRQKPGLERALRQLRRSTAAADGS